jgi:hypothetical protein
VLARGAVFRTGGGLRRALTLRYAASMRALFKTVVDSGAISLSGLSPGDPESNIRSPATELYKALSFLGVGLGAWMDFSRGFETGLVPHSLPAAVIHFTLVCVFAICAVSCFARFLASRNLTK